MTLQLFPSEFPYIWLKFDFLNSEILFIEIEEKFWFQSTRDIRITNYIWLNDNWLPCEGGLHPEVCDSAPRQREATEAAAAWQTQSG
jgi:hypothetical protein